ncbi:MAG: PAS domain-containing protein [Anaerolineaceae bacterium]|nr:PAS domain-containing protein [Anaerolineaceae bacterium]
MNNFDYFSEIQMAVTVCDPTGIILYMNKRSIETFQKDGGADLIGKNLFDCHPGRSREKLANLMATHTSNSYTIEKNGVHKMIHQTPWFEDGEFKGFIEFSFVIPVEVPHFVRG